MSRSKSSGASGCWPCVCAGSPLFSKKTRRCPHCGRTQEEALEIQRTVPAVMEVVRFNNGVTNCPAYLRSDQQEIVSGH